MQLCIISPSGGGKTTAHEAGLSYDVESHPDYKVRADHYDWGTGDPKLKDIRNKYWEVFTEGALASNFDSVSTHHSHLPFKAEHAKRRRVVACIQIPGWELVQEEDKFGRSRLVAMAMTLAKVALAIADGEIQNVAEGFVSDLAQELKVKPYDVDERLFEEERIFNAISAQVSALDEEHGYQKVSA